MVGLYDNLTGKRSCLASSGRPGGGKPSCHLGGLAGISAASPWPSPGPVRRGSRDVRAWRGRGWIHRGRPGEYPRRGGSSPWSILAGEHIDRAEPARRLSGGPGASRVSRFAGKGHRRSSWKAVAGCRLPIAGCRLPKAGCRISRMPDCRGIPPVTKFPP
jgi:hypothetical protein